MEKVQRTAKTPEVGGLGTDGLSAEAEAMLGKLARQFETGAAVEAVFGQPQTFGDRMIIPVARVMGGFGGGFGPTTQRAAREMADAPAKQTAAPGSATPFSLGGGAGMRIEPVAVLVIDARRVKILPVVDANKMIGRVFSSVFGFMIAALAIRAWSECHGAQRHTAGKTWRGGSGLAQLRRMGRFGQIFNLMRLTSQVRAAAH